MVGSLGPRTADSEFRDRMAKEEKVRIFLFNQHPGSFWCRWPKA